MKSLITLVVITLPLHLFSQDIRSEKNQKNTKKYIKLLEKWNATDTIDEFDKYINLIDIGNGYYRLKDIDLSYQYFTEAAEFLPDASLAYRYVAEVELWDYQMPEKALSSIDKAIFYNEVNPDLYNTELVDTSEHCSYLLIRSICYDDLNKIGKEIDDLNQSDSLCGLPHEALYDRSQLYLQETKEYSKAIDDLSRAIDLEDGDWEYYYERAWAYYKNSECEKGLSDLDKSTQLKGEWTSNDLYLKGLLLKDLDREVEAIASFTKSLELDKNEYTYYHRGLCYIIEIQYDKALRDFINANKLNKKESDYYEWIGHSYSLLGNESKACDNYYIAASMGNKNVIADIAENCSE